MIKTSSKRPRRSLKAGNSPEPSFNAFAACGHSHCGASCRVRYVGPTSRIHDHHILHAARGTSHAWTAAVVAGLAVVITGAIAFQSMNAEARQVDDQRAQASTKAILQRLNRMDARMSEMETKIEALNMAVPAAQTVPPASLDTVFPTPKNP